MTHCATTAANICPLPSLPSALWPLFEFFMCHSFGGGLCVVFLSPLFLLSRASFFAHVAPAATNRGESFFVYLLCFSRFFCHLPLSSALHLFMLCSHSLGVLPLFALYAVAARAQLIFVDSFFVHAECVCVFENALVCVCER